VSSGWVERDGHTKQQSMARGGIGHVYAWYDLNMSYICIYIYIYIYSMFIVILLRSFGIDESPSGSVVACFCCVYR